MPKKISGLRNDESGDDWKARPVTLWILKFEIHLTFGFWHFPLFHMDKAFWAATYPVLISIPSLDFSSMQ